MSASSEQPKCSFSLELSAERSEYVVNQLRAFNRPRRSPLWSHPPQPGAPLEIYALDGEGAVVGGLIGQTNPRLQLTAACRHNRLRRAR